MGRHLIGAVGYTEIEHCICHTSRTPPVLRRVAVDHPNYIFETEARRIPSTGVCR
jgi:hypothetical protein